MSEKEEKESNENSEKIFFGEKSEYCFACGTKLDHITKKCLYCDTEQS